MAQNETLTAFNSLISLCLQGRCKEGLSVAHKINVAQLPLKKRRVVEAFIERFSSNIHVQKKSENSIQKLISIYEEYWHQVLLDSTKSAQSEKRLLRNILSWLKKVRGIKMKTSSAEKIVTRLKKEIEAMGYFCITGTVSPFQELEIWRKQRPITYSVRLPETNEKVKTILMSEFLTKGWLAYSTMGLQFPGGWAKKEGLYCNTHAYNLKSEKFRVSYLGHEAQHYSDYKRFPQLGQADLEYRAKLTEFALAKKTSKKMYQVFASRADYNKKSPHAFSYFCVVRDLAKAMKGHENFNLLAENPSAIKTKEINRAAESLLKQHSEALKAKGAKKIRSYIA